MEIRTATAEDKNRILEIYARARRFMADNGNYAQWGPTKWPPSSLIDEDIALGKSMVCIHDEKIVGVFYFNQGEAIDRTYDVIEDGEWSSDEAYGVIHRIASDGTPGVGTFCIKWGLDRCGYLRMDTHASNVPMNNLLTGLGFRMCGIIHVVEDNYPRNAYDIKKK